MTPPITPERNKKKAAAEECFCGSFLFVGASVGTAAAAAADGDDQEGDTPDGGAAA